MRSQFLSNDRGTAAVEFGLLAPMLVAILLPTVDLGMVSYEKMRVENAAEAGAQYALEHGYSSTAITTAAQDATSLGTGVTVSPSEACMCVNSTGLTDASPATPPCSGTCSDGSTPGTYVTVGTTASYTMLLSYPGLTNPMTLNGTATIRIN